MIPGQPRWAKVLLILTAILAASAALVALINAGVWSNYDWTWTGFMHKTLWDWMQLLLLPIALSAGAVLLTYAISHMAHTLQLRRDLAEQRVAVDNQQETLLRAYLDRLSVLLLDTHLRESDPNSEGRLVLRALTLTILPRLDAQRKRSLLRFLYESGLITMNQESDSLLRLSGADLSGAHLSGANLSRVNLSFTDLHGASLRGTNFREADLIKADLRGADLRQAVLCRANLSGADLSRAHLSEANALGVVLREAILHEATASGADLREADLRETILSGARLSGATLSEADLRNANLSEARLRGAKLSKTNLGGAQLIKADLSRTDLRGADLSRADLQGADVREADLHEAILSLAKLSMIIATKEQRDQFKVAGHL